MYAPPAQTSDTMIATYFPTSLISPNWPSRIHTGQVRNCHPDDERRLERYEAERPVATCAPLLALEPSHSD
jgi:hypothetical protein